MRKQSLIRFLMTAIFKPSDNISIVQHKYNLHGKYVILGVASTWERRKGLNDFIQLSKRLNQDEVIVLIGLNQKQKVDLPKNVIGLSRTENKKELVDLYNASDVFLNLSAEETFGLATAEAMACGTPAIVYDATACPELVIKIPVLSLKKINISSLINAVSVLRKNEKTFYSEKCRGACIF